MWRERTHNQASQTQLFSIYPAWPLQASQQTSHSTKPLSTAGWQALTAAGPGTGPGCDSLLSVFLESRWEGAKKGPETANSGGQPEAMMPQGGGSPELGKTWGWMMRVEGNLPRRAVRRPHGASSLCLSPGGSRGSVPRGPWVHPGTQGTALQAGEAGGRERSSGSDRCRLTPPRSPAAPHRPPPSPCSQSLLWKGSGGGQPSPHIPTPALEDSCFFNSGSKYEKFSPFADTFKKRVSKNTFFVLVRVVDELW